MHILGQHTLSLPVRSVYGSRAAPPPTPPSPLCPPLPRSVFTHCDFGKESLFGPRLALFLPLASTDSTRPKEREINPHQRPLSKDTVITHHCACGVCLTATFLLKLLSVLRLSACLVTCQNMKRLFVRDFYSKTLWEEHETNSAFFSLVYITQNVSITLIFSLITPPRLASS